LASNEYPEMGNHPCFPAGEAAGEMIYPKLYYQIHPFVMEACDEMDMHGIVMPTRQMMYCMCDRICERIFRVYPEMAKVDVEYEAEADVDTTQLPGGLGEEFRRMFPGEEMPRNLEDLRRRHPREFEEFRRRHPESFRRGSIFRDFILFLLFLEFFRRRGRF
jgi:hypothetical protein